MDPHGKDTDGRASGGWHWQRAECLALIEALATLRAALLEEAARQRQAHTGLPPDRLDGVSNLAHYLALRRFDLRGLQRRLSALGLSSLGRAETQVLASVERVLAVLHCMAGLPGPADDAPARAGPADGGAGLQARSRRLLGVPPAGRGTRIMVTLPGEAAHGDAIVQSLIAAGMDLARINCAHDGAAAWRAMSERVRRLAAAQGREVRILMDLGGPKIRTGAMAPAAPVVKVKPPRDEYGRVLQPALTGLRPAGATAPVEGASQHVGVDVDWLLQLGEGDDILVRDTRGAHRSLDVVRCGYAGALVRCDRTVYLGPATRLVAHAAGGPALETAIELPERPGSLRLRVGDRLLLGAEAPGRPAQLAADGQVAEPARVACTLPQALAQIRVGDPVWFDDGSIGCIAREATAQGWLLEVVQAPDGGARLGADKGINLPATRLDVPALSDKDVQDLRVAVECADIVGLSFAQRPGDVAGLRRRLAELGAPHLGVLLKIETRQGFERLPELLFEAMAFDAAGVMIARGDLAVECGFERLAEVQEEILWACEAAHLPVVWATQVLESLAKSGLPSRAEISDAAMGVRAECVMLNKGPHVAAAVRTLDDILRRMSGHQDKKRSLLRALKSWGDAAAPGPAGPA